MPEKPFTDETMPVSKFAAKRRLQAVDKWDQFDQERRQLYHKLKREAGSNPNIDKIHTDSWRLTLIRYPEALDRKIDVFAKQRSKKERRIKQEKQSKEALERAQQEARSIPQVDVGEVTVEQLDEKVDILRDIRWVYANLPRIFKTDNLGVERLDENALVTAPSNGCIALAHYALVDKKAFFERFIIKILPKDLDSPADPDAATGKDDPRETDPGLEDLERYMKGVQPKES